MVGGQGSGGKDRMGYTKELSRYIVCGEWGGSIRLLYLWRVGKQQRISQPCRKMERLTGDEGIHTFGDKEKMEPGQGISVNRCGQDDVASRAKFVSHGIAANRIMSPYIAAPRLSSSMFLIGD